MTYQLILPKRKNIIANSIREFKIIRILGQGAFGQVFECQHIKSNLIYAIKKVTINR